MNNIKIDIKTIITFIISALLIVVFNNLNINNYNKNIILPFIILVLSYIFLLFKNKDINKKAYYFLIPIIGILISNFIIKIDMSNKFLNVIILPILIAIFLNVYTNNNYKNSNNYIKWVLKLFPNRLFSNLKFLKLDLKNKNTNKAKNVFKGIIIGGFIGFIILELLTSADYYFAFFIGKLIPKLNFNFGNVFMFIITFIILFSIFVNVLLNKKEDLGKLSKKNIDNTLIITILSIINFIFILFVVSELSRLTTNFLNIPEKYTYSSYAREGFFELLFVTVINFLIIIYNLYKTDNLKNNKIVKYLVILLISFSIILIFNSFYRMFLYINHYNSFTVLRLQVVLFLLMELIIFILLIKKIIRELKYKDSFIFYIILVSFYIINLYLCNDSFVKILNKIFR